MGKALLVAVPNTFNTTDNNERATLVGYNTSFSTETTGQISCTEAATFSKLAARIKSGNSGAATIVFRKNATTVTQTISITGSPGAAEDTTNTDTLAAADLFNLLYTDTGTGSSLQWLKANVEFSSGHGNYHGSANGPGTYAIASATRYLPYAGVNPDNGDATEANQQWKNRGYTNQAALQVRVRSNARTTTTTFKNRINGVDGSASIAFSASETGLKTHIGLTDALSAGDLTSVSITTGSGTETIGIAFVVGTFKSTDTKSETIAASGVGLTRAASATADYIAIGGGAAKYATETDTKIKVGFAGLATNLRCYLSANTYTGAATLKLIKNGAAVITTTIGASGGAAWYENTSDTVTFTDTDEFSFEIDEGTSGSITIRSIGVTFAPSSTGLAVKANRASAFGVARPFMRNQSPVTPSTAAWRQSSGNIYAGNLVASGSAAQDLTPALFTNSQTFYAPVVTVGAVDLTPALFTNSQTFYAPVVTVGAVDLTPALFTNSQSFYSPTVSVGAVDLTPALYTNSQTFYSPTVSVGSVTLTPALYTNSQTFYSPTVSVGSVTLTPALYTNSQTFYSPTVSVGSVTLTPALYTNNNTFYEPTVVTGEGNLYPALFTNSNAFYSPTITTTAGDQELTPNLYSNSNSFYAPTVGVGSVALTPALYTNSQTFYSPSVDLRLNASLFTNSQTFYAPAVGVGSVALTPALYTDSQTFYAPRVGLRLGASLLTNSQTFYEPTVGVGSVALTPSLYSNSNSFYRPTITTGAVDLTPSLYTNNQAFYAHNAVVSFPLPSSTVLSMPVRGARITENPNYRLFLAEDSSDITLVNGRSSMDLSAGFTLMDEVDHILTNKRASDLRVVQKGGRIPHNINVSITQPSNPVLGTLWLDMN